MARRNLKRSLLAATLMVVSGAAGMLAVPAPAGAAEEPPFVPDYRVTVNEDSFSPNVIEARPNETIQFDLAPGVGTNHTVTLRHGKCATRPWVICEETFENPEDPPIFMFSDYGEYEFYDRIAEEAGVVMRGRFVITDNPLTVPPPPPPPTTSTTLATTTTSRPVTTTTRPPTTTTTTAPSTIRPFLIAPDPTTTTTAPKPASTATTGSTKNDPGASAAGAKDKSKGKGDGKGKAASTDDPATAGSPSPDGSPLVVTFDPSMLTPLPETTGTGSETNTPDTGAEESAMLDLLGADSAAEDATHLLIIGCGILGCLLLLTGGVAWFRRSSRYFPA